jgi:hypothetical protein
MKKFLSISAAAVLAMGFAACSSDEPVVTTNPATEDDGSGNYIQFVVSMPDNSSRAGYTENETSGSYAVGSDIENDVKNVYAYFAIKDGDGTFVTMSDGKSYATYPAYKVSSDAAPDVIEAAGQGTGYTTAKERMDNSLQIGTTYEVYLLCNKPAPESVKTVSDLLKSTLEFKVSESDSIATNGIPMAARSIAGTITDELTPSLDNTIANPAVLSYEVERSFARITFAGDNIEVPLYEYAKDPTTSKDADGNTTANYDNAAQNAIGKIKLLKYYIVNQANEYYTYRHVGNLVSTEGVISETMPDLATDAATLFGPITTEWPYAVDPHSGDKTSTGSVYTAGYHQLFTYAYRHYGAFKEVKAKSTLGYLPENLMAQEAQRKGQATGVIFQVQLEPNEVINADGSTSAYTPGKNLYYYDGKFYADIDAVTAKVSSEINLSNYVKFDVKYYAKGLAYYEYFIRHANNYKYTQMANMEFAIVRNNSYELNIISAAMTPYTSLVPTTKPDTDDDPDDPENVDPDDPDLPDWVDPDKPGDPTKDNPDPDGPNSGDDVESATTYLKVEVVVRPWIMRKNITILGQ